MTLTVRSATVEGATTKGSPLSHAELDENFNHLSQSANHSFTPSGTTPTTRTVESKLQDFITSADFAADANYVSAVNSLAVYVGVSALETDDGSAASPAIRGVNFDTTGFYFATGPKLLGSLGGTRVFEISGTSFFAGPSAGAAITSGVDNVMIGDLAGRLFTNSNLNVIIGNDTARQSATQTNECVIIGAEAGFAIAGGHNATLVGKQAGRGITSGQQNTFIGHSAGQDTTVGGSNVGVGRAAMTDNITGGFNVAVGHAAGFQYTDGDGNTWIGNQAGNAIAAATPTTGDNNVAIGQLCGPTVAGLSGTICIGAGDTAAASATVTAANTTKIGFGQTDATISGQFHSSQDIETVNSDTGVTLTIDQFHASMILRTGTAGAGITDVTPTAAAIVAAIPGCEVGSGYDLYIQNTTGQTLTLDDGNGVTLAGTTTVANGQTRLFKVYATNVTASSEAVTVRGVFTAAN